MAAVREVMDENQTTINNPSLGFKGFVPAVFGRLVSERFSEKVGDRAEIKVTAPTFLVRNRRALPDAWESGVIDGKHSSPDWAEGQAFAELPTKEGPYALRVLLPETKHTRGLHCKGRPTGRRGVR